LKNISRNIVRNKEFWIESNSIGNCFTLYIEMDLCHQTLSVFIKVFQFIEFGEEEFQNILKYFVLRREVLYTVLIDLNYFQY
jgi:hypothetical protein